MEMSAVLLPDPALNVLGDLADRITSDGKQLIVVSETLRWRSFRGRSTADISIIDNYQHTESASQMQQLINDEFTRQYLAQEGHRFERYRNTLEKIQQMKGPRHLTILDRMDYICPGDRCVGVNEELDKYFYDYAHHTVTGARYFGRNLHSTKFYEDLIVALDSISSDSSE